MADEKPPRTRRRARKATAKSLENGALFYLQRFASSRANLERVLMRRVERSVRDHGTDREEGRALVAEIVTRFAAAGLVDDATYAAGRVRSLHARGASARLIRSKLREKGVPDDIIADALAAREDEHEDPEMAAAAALARRRRLGPYRAEAERPARREKDLAALARAGFSYDIARQVVDAADPESLF